MADLYPILLKNTEQKKFGVNLMNIIIPKSKGEVVETKKLLVTYNGEVQEPINCQSITVKCEDDTIMLDIVLVKENEEHPATKAVPQAEAVIPTSETDTFTLQGDDLESLELLSDFRKEENQDQKGENDKLEAYTLESGTFNIQDLSSIQNAVLDIVEKEKQFIDQGYKVFKINAPRFDYENKNDFKLVESVVMMKRTIEVVENNK